MKKRINDWIERQKKVLMEEKIRREEIKMKRLKRRQKKLSKSKPGAVKAIREGLLYKKGVREVMREEYERRKYEREQRSKRRD